MTALEKNNLRKLLIGIWELLKSENKTEALTHIDEIVDVCDQFDKGNGNGSELSSRRGGGRPPRV